MTNKDYLLNLLYDSKCPAWFVDNNQIMRFAEYLVENGVIVLPCKVGNTVYDISDGTVYKTRVLQFIIFQNGKLACRTVSGFPNVEEFGVRIFLTKEEAEAALKSRQQNV